MKDDEKQDPLQETVGVNPDSTLFEDLESGILRITSVGASVEGSIGRILSAWRHALIGRPIATAQELNQRLSKVQALPILASDNMSSSAYATEQIVRVLAIAGVGALSLTLPITFALIGVLAIVVLSYSQITRAYPAGGGSYAAARENLGVVPGLVAAASILVDYVLTVAVSVAAGVEALTSVAPHLFGYRVALAILIIMVLVIGNLRGVRESGTLFSAPTYIYILSLLGLLAYGLYRFISGTLPTFVPPPGWTPNITTSLSFLLVLRAFSSGAVALTGVEAVADGIRVLKPPETRNANIILFWMAGLFGMLFLGVSFLASHVGLVPDPTEQETLISQLVRLLVGGGWFHLLIQLATALILLLAANTAFVGFPRLSAVLARDRFFPNQFLLLGDRLALSTGIITVGILAGLFVAMFGGSVAALIPLYTIGVFVAFTLSQAGMVRYWRRVKDKGWRVRMLLNGLGMVVTGFVALEAVTVKFSHGAWIVFFLIPLIVLVMLAIRRHYFHLAHELRLRRLPSLERVTQPHLVFVPVEDLNRPVIDALAYALRLSTEVRAVHVTYDVASAERLRKRWEEWTKDITLVVIEAPYRHWTSALLSYLDSVSKQNPNVLLTVVIPEFIPRHWWEHMLHSQGAMRLKLALLSRPNVVVVDVPYRLKM